MEEKSHKEPTWEVAEVIYKQHAFGTSVRALSRIHRLPMDTVRRVIREHEKRQKSSGQWTVVSD